jgi:hypothetical protein
MWNTDENGERSLNVSFDAPVAQALGLTVGAKLIAALKHSGHHYSSIESLEAITVDTSLSSLRSILNTEGTPEYIASQTSAGISNWNLYMITGVIVARGSKTIIQEGSRQKEYGFNTSAYVFSTYEKPATVLILRNKTRSGSEIGAMKVQGRDFAQNTDSRLRDGIGDYVWAVRLMKITKRWFNRTWHPETFGVGAVFGTDGDAQSVDVDGIIHAENMRAAGMLHTESGGTFVLLQPREETS